MVSKITCLPGKGIYSICTLSIPSYVNTVPADVVIGYVPTIRHKVTY